jgi:hypothetical protein
MSAEGVFGELVALLPAGSLDADLSVAAAGGDGLSHGCDSCWLSVMMKILFDARW